jgi:hypothetical protein
MSVGGSLLLDFDSVAEDRSGYRVVFVEAFRHRGILPGDVPALSVETLRWEGVDVPRAAERYRPIVNSLRTSPMIASTSRIVTAYSCARGKRGERSRNHADGLDFRPRVGHTTGP